MVFDPESVEELRTVARVLDMSQTNVRRKARDIVRKAALEVEKGAKLRAPVDTGALRNSISTTLFGAGLGAGDTIAAEVGPEVHYGIYVEYGTYKMAPRPYLGPAFDEVEPGFAAALEELGGQALEDE